MVGAALGRFYCSAFKDELTRARLTFSYTYIHSHTHTPIEAHHAQCRRQGHASVRRPAGNRPTNNRGRHARPVASMRTKGGTSWRSRKRERVSALEGRQRTFCCWLARPSDLLQLGLRALAVCACFASGLLCDSVVGSLSRSNSLYIGRSRARSTSSAVGPEQIQIYCEQSSSCAQATGGSQWCLMKHNLCSTF